MPRQDVPYGGAICRLKERLAEIWDKLGEKLHSINGVEGDAAGNVEIVSGDAAIVVTSDQVNHQIKVALDSSQLPAASVSSVNGQTGAVALTADDIPSDNGDVQTDLDALALRVTANGTAISNEVTDRQNADSTLQTNINSSNGRISVLESEDADNMKLNANQTATGDNTFSGRLKATGNPAYTPQQPTDDVATIATLDGYRPMIRTTGNQEKSGIMTFKTAVALDTTFGNAWRGFVRTVDKTWASSEDIPTGNTNIRLIELNGPSGYFLRLNATLTTDGKVRVQLESEDIVNGVRTYRQTYLS